jgi:HlyD family secretion protein
VIPKKQIFRKVALERLASPEQLDLVMQVTSPQSWIALGAVGLLLVTLVIWGILGSIPEKTQATGILLQQSGIFDVDAPGTGQIVEVGVIEGDTIVRGQVVGRIAQPEIVQQIEGARSQLAELRAQHEQLVSFKARDKTLRDDTLEIQRQKTRDTIKFLEERLEALQGQIEDTERLLERGLVTRQTVLQVREQYFSTQDQIQASKSELTQLSMRELSSDAERRQAIEQSSLRISEGERRLQALEEQLDEASLVETPYAGRVLEVKVARGDLVGRGSPLFSLQIDEAGGESLQVVAYLPPGTGKSVRPGMELQVSPSTSKREEYGFLIGQVEYVSEFPSTREGMKRVLANDSLVAALSGQGAPFAVYGKLLPDPASVSGYQWSSTKGNSQPVAAGTMCGVTVILRDRSPISMVIPIFREYSGL